MLIENYRDNKGCDVLTKSLHKIIKQCFGI
ncbi:hypothetical protein [Dickeya dadantii]